MRNKLLLSTLSLSFLLAANAGHAGLIEEDFIVMSKTSSYSNSAVREQEKTVRNLHNQAIKAAEDASDAAGQAAKSWWSWGSKSVMTSGSTMIAAPDLKTNVVGVGVWSLGWVLGKFSDSVGDSVTRHAKDKSTKTVTYTSNLINIDYTKSDADITSEFANLEL